MDSLRILLVGREGKTTRSIARLLRENKPERIRVVRAARVPRRIEGFDAAVLVAPARGGLPPKCPDLPAVVVGAQACGDDRAALVRRGVQCGLTPVCATCELQPNLIASIRWAIERAHLEQELERTRERERQTALHDPLTGLANLRLYREKLRQLLAQGRRTKKQFALLLVDLDGFKQVNDRIGHAGGDQLLREVAERLSTSIRETDAPVRRGGDEFVVLLDDVRGASDAVHVARKLLRRVSRPTVVRGTVVRATASIGVAVFPDDGKSAAALERRADLAMYQAKQLGGNAAILASSRAAIVAATDARTRRKKAVRARAAADAQLPARDASA